MSHHAPSTIPTPAWAWEMRGIHKTFGAVRALDGADFTLRQGEVHALLGENGAGKTTLMKVLYGLLRPTGGEIFRGGERVVVSSPQRAIALGIAFVQQHFALVDSLTVAENIVLGTLPARTYHPRKIARDLQPIIDRTGLGVDAAAPVHRLAVGQKQRVEILKALYRNAQFILLDEPTSVLAPHEVEALFELIRTLRRTGTGFVFISHKLQEVLRIADRITVMRQGKTVAALQGAEAELDRLAELMVGEEPPGASGPAPAMPGPASRSASPVLVLADVEVRGDAGRLACKNISFTLRQGQILGIAGVDGNGQTELAEAILGLRAVRHGAVRWLGHQLSSRRPDRCRVGFIPQDREREALVPDFSIAENCMLELSHAAPFQKAGLLQQRFIRAYAAELIAEYAVVCDGPDQTVRQLSGGNRQKVVVGRALKKQPEVVIAMNPTWGVDVASAGRLQQKLRALCQAGAAVLLFSTDLDEIYNLADEFLVMYIGRIVGTGNRATSRRQAGLWMAGVEKPDAGR